MLGHLVTAVRSLLFYLTAFVLTVVIGVFILLWDIAFRRTNFDYYVATKVWCRTLLWAAGVRYRVVGREHVDPDRSYVIVSNHLSNLDALLEPMVLRNLHARFLAKKELYRLPIMGWALHMMGMVKVDRERAGASHDYINRQVAQVFAAGRSLMIYPEGTRSRSVELRPFKKGPFVIAIRHQVPILPVVVHGTAEAWTPGDWRVRGGPVVMAIGAPIETSGLGHQDEVELRSRTHETLRAMYTELRAQS